jgi:hypothetical protein
MASIYDKVQPISGLLIKSLCDTLIKLAVRGPDIQPFNQRISDNVLRLS